MKKVVKKKQQKMSKYYIFCCINFDQKLKKETKNVFFLFKQKPELK